MRFSASRSPLLPLCLYSFRSDVDAPEAESSSDAKIGTIAWARAAAYIEGRPDPGNGDLDSDDAEDCDAYYAAAVAWAKDIKRIGWRCEIKFAWSPSTDKARELPPSDKLRDYYHTPDCAPDCTKHCSGDERPGSTDIVCFDGEGVLCVDDVKTGRTPLRQYIPQARTLGLFAARSYGVQRVRVRLVKLHKDGKPPEIWSDELRRPTLDGIASDLAIRLETAERDKPEPNPGAHCNEMWCGARLVCPVVPAAVAELVPAEALVKLPMFSKEFVTHDHDAKQLELLRLIEAASKQLKDVIKKRTPAEGVYLDDGRFFREDFHTETRYRKESLIGKIRELAALAGIPADDVERHVEDCAYSFQKSEGLRVKAAKRSAA